MGEKRLYRCPPHQPFRESASFYNSNVSSLQTSTLDSRVQPNWNSIHGWRNLGYSRVFSSACTLERDSVPWERSWATPLTYTLVVAHTSAFSRSFCEGLGVWERVLVSWSRFPSWMGFLSVVVWDIEVERKRTGRVATSLAVTFESHS